MAPEYDRRGRPRKFSPEDVARELRAAKGLLSVTARRLACDPKVVRSYIAKYPEIAQAQFEAKEELKDFTESKLFARIDAEDMQAIQFFLRTQAEDRGYNNDKQRIEFQTVSPIQIEVVWPGGDGEDYDE